MIFSGEIYAEWIDVLLIFVELKMEVWTGSSPGRADKANDLTFFNRYATVNAFGKSV